MTENLFEELPAATGVNPDLERRAGIHIAHFAIVAECRDEVEQRALFEELRRRGIKCRPIT